MKTFEKKLSALGSLQSSEWNKDKFSLYFQSNKILLKIWVGKNYVILIRTTTELSHGGGKNSLHTI